ncbi:MAG: hypothetical protein ACK4JY_14270 [Brevundimonas sp.]|uniref:hypothetical protein n=1 Tax=Brevundimonas sp. TaxID=1871086 RepID=UPI003919C541
MSRYRNDPELALLDLEAWDSPWRLSEDDLHAQAGADRPHGGRPVDEREDDR